MRLVLLLFWEKGDDVLVKAASSTFCIDHLDSDEIASRKMVEKKGKDKRGCRR